MARTQQTSNSELGLVDWFLAHHESLRQGRFPARSPEIAAFLGFLWPQNLEYASPLNPIFMGECMNLSLLNSAPVWQARDGLVPLLWFFKSNPVPKGVRSQLFVEESLSPFVPTAWRKIAGTYRVEAMGKAPAKVKGLVLTGIMMDTYCSAAYAEEKAKTIVKALGAKAVASMEILAFIPPRLDGFGNEHRHEFVGEFVSALCRILGNHIRFLDWRKLDSMQSLAGYIHVDMNEELLVADGYMTHFALSRGARPLPDRGGAKRANPARDVESSFVQLSPFHGIRVCSRLKGGYALADRELTLRENAAILEKLQAATRSETNKRFPWPLWFTAWSRGAAAQARRGAH